MRTYNCARVYVGDYSYGYIAFLPQDNTYHTARCGYSVVEGSVISKRLRPVKVRGAQDSEGDDKYHILETFVIYPTTDEAIIAIYNRKGKHLVKLTKRREGSRSTIFKARI